MYHKIEEIPSPPHSKQWDEMRRWYAPQRNPIESLRLVIPKGLIGCPFFFKYEGRWQGFGAASATSGSLFKDTLKLGFVSFRGGLEPPIL